MTIQQQVENTEKAIQYYTEMIEKYPENENMKLAKEEQEERLKLFHLEPYKNEGLKKLCEEIAYNQDIGVMEATIEELKVYSEGLRKALVDKTSDTETLKCKVIVLEKTIEENKSKIAQLIKDLQNSVYHVNVESENKLFYKNDNDRLYNELEKLKKELSDLKENRYEFICFNVDGDEKSYNLMEVKEELEEEIRDLKEALEITKMDLETRNEELSEEFNLRESLNKIIESQAIVIKNLEGELHLKNNRFLEVK